jgi:microcystin-dependent protein
MLAIFLDKVSSTPIFRGDRIAIYAKTDGSIYTKTAAGIEILLGGIISNFSTGDVKLTLKVTADPTWIMCNDGTIGNAASGATTRANADTEDLFVLLWNNISDTYATVSGGRGVSGAADFAADKTISLTKMLGRALALAGSGAGLTSRNLGETLGVEAVSLSAAQNGQHTHIQDAHTHTQNAHSHTFALAQGAGTAHALEGGGNANGDSTTSVVAVNQNATAVNQNSGAGDPHENMPPESFLNAMIKL